MAKKKEPKEVKAEETPGLMEGYEPGEKKNEPEPVPEWTPKGKGQITLEGEEVPKATIYIKPAGVPYEIRTEKFRLNTTEEGFKNRLDSDPTELLQWVVKKLKVQKEAVILPGDFDAHAAIMVDVITGKIEAPRKHVGDED